MHASRFGNADGIAAADGQGPEILFREVACASRQIQVRLIVRKLDARHFVLARRELFGRAASKWHFIKMVEAVPL